MTTDLNSSNSVSSGNMGQLAIVRSDFFIRDRLLRRFLGWAKPTSARNIFKLILLILVPLVVMSLITISENRFSFGSVTWESHELDGVVIDLGTLPDRPASTDGQIPNSNSQPIPYTLNKPKVRGMSFLGDTMVWPYAILLPFLLLLLNVALSRFERFFASVKQVLSKDWLEKNPDTYNQIVDQTRATLAGEGAWRLFKILAISAGFIFFAWNTVTCTWADIFKPYKADAPYVLIDNKYVQLETSMILESPRPVETIFPVQVPKWDCDPDVGFLSWVVARLWVLLIGYVWIPFILFKLANLVAAIYIYTKKLSSHKNALDIKPLSPDQAGGLSRLASLATALTYPIVVVGLMMAMPFFKENTNVSLHNLVLFIPFVPVFFAVFFIPLLGVHRAMVTAKDEYLEQFSELFDKVNAQFIREVKAPSLEINEFTRLEISMRGLTDSYDKISKMPVWPFEISTLYRLGTAVLIPVLVPMILDMLIRWLLA